MVIGPPLRLSIRATDRPAGPETGDHEAGHQFSTDNSCASSYLFLRSTPTRDASSSEWPETSSVKNQSSPPKLMRSFSLISAQVLHLQSEQVISIVSHLTRLRLKFPRLCPGTERSCSSRSAAVSHHRIPRWASLPPGCGSGGEEASPRRAHLTDSFVSNFTSEATLNNLC